MKRTYLKRFSALLIIALLLLWLNNYLSYSRRIGNTRFYLLETMAISNEGEPLAGLYYSPTDVSGYKSVEMSGFPMTILWNDKYLISKIFDGNSPNIDSYVVINRDSVCDSDGSCRKKNGSRLQTLFTANKIAGICIE